MNKNEAQAQLDYIQNIIKENREKTADSSQYFIFWGILIAFSMIL